MAGKYDQLHIMTNHSTKYESRTEEPMNERTNRQSEKLYMAPYYHMQVIKTDIT
jgi:hypothetical protein